MWHWKLADADATPAWRGATPFPHLVIDDLVAADDLAPLFEILEDEPVERYLADLYDFEATAPVPTTEAFAAMRDAFAAAFAPPLARITGKPVTRVDLRAYAYRAGHYLLPHADHQEGLERQLAFAYYLPSPEPPRGGELELYRCRVDATGAIVETTSAALIEARANRLVVFDVSAISLHQVREVLDGARLSLSGWFYS
jgi:Rps23 Pro-64 3,4-dihydroxylase Tpa1-like proline 4-hydroxylase